jgi:spermidine/putrescine transport system ATP-binding protein
VTDGEASCVVLDTKVAARVEEDLAPGPAAVVIRPERLAMAAADADVPPGRNVLRGMVRDVVYLGATTRVHVELAAGHTLTVEIPNHDGPSSLPHPPGATVQCVCAPDAVRVLRRSSAQVVEPAS